MAVANALSKMAPWLGPVAGGLYLAAKAQMALNLALDANPIGLVILGLVALAVAIKIGMGQVPGIPHCHDCHIQVSGRYRPGIDRHNAARIRHTVQCSWASAWKGWSGVPVGCLYC